MGIKKLNGHIFFKLAQECSVVNTLVGHSESRTTSARWKDVYDVSEIKKDFGDRGVSPLEALIVQGQRPGLERTVSQADQTGSSADGPDDDFASALSRSSSGG